MQARVVRLRRALHRQKLATARAFACAPHPRVERADAARTRQELMSATATMRSAHSPLTRTTPRSANASEPHDVAGQRVLGWMSTTRRRARSVAASVVSQCPVRGRLTMLVPIAESRHVDDLEERVRAYRSTELRRGFIAERTASGSPSPRHERKLHSRGLSGQRAERVVASRKDDVEPRGASGERRADAMPEERQGRFCRIDSARIESACGGFPCGCTEPAGVSLREAFACLEDGGQRHCAGFRIDTIRRAQLCLESIQNRSAGRRSCNPAAGLRIRSTVGGEASPQSCRVIAR